MADIVSKEVRSRMMSGIRGTNTRPELVLRRGLHKRGFRYRLHTRKLPGKPDLAFPKHNAVIFANGCFWHGHDCHLFKWPQTREEFWRTKISANKERDTDNLLALRAQGWRVGIVWECAIKGKTRRPPDDVLDQCADWLVSDLPEMEIQGK